MNILLVGDFSKNHDEGLKNVAKYFNTPLSKNHNVKTLNIKEFSFRFFSTNKEFTPDVVHHFTTPTLFSFVIFFLMTLKWPKSKKFMSSLHSKPSIFLKLRLIRKILKYILRINFLLYQANENLFTDLSYHKLFFPNGVDVNKFKPVKTEEKLALRDKYGIDQTKFVIVHVGHIINERNLEIFNQIQKMDENYQVLIIGSEYLYVDEDILKELEDNGCKVLIKYFNNIEEIYAMADCYVFPVLWGNTISMPLTILEAMAVDLPVISIEYPFFSIFNSATISTYKNSDDMKAILSEFRLLNRENIKINNRKEILPYSWINLAEKLEKLYVGSK